MRDDHNVKLNREEKVPLTIEEIRLRIKRKGLGSDMNNTQDHEAYKRKQVNRKRAAKKEYVSRELHDQCLSLYNYLLKMKKCSYVSQSFRYGKYG